MVEIFFIKKETKREKPTICHLYIKAYGYLRTFFKNRCSITTEINPISCLRGGLNIDIKQLRNKTFCVYPASYHIMGNTFFNSIFFSREKVSHFRLIQSNVKETHFFLYVGFCLTHCTPLFRSRETTSLPL